MRRDRFVLLVVFTAALACSDNSGPTARYLLTITGGDAQTDTVGKVLTIPYTVKVTDQAGANAAGVTVSWSVTAGGGSITPSSTTDAAGIATATRTLGTVSGAATAAAQAGGTSVTFSATALADPPDHMLKSAGDVQTGGTGVALPVPFAVLVQDQYNNPVESVTVNWAVTAGGGTLSATTSKTDGFGVARTTLTLGDTAGPNTVTATSPTLGATLTFSATASAGPQLVTSLPIAQNYGLHDQFIRDGLAFLCAWNSGVLVYDVGNGIKGGSPASPQLVGQLITADTLQGSHIGARVHNAWWFHNPVTNERKYLFIGQEGSGIIGASSSGDIHVVDVSDLANPKEVALFRLQGAGTHNFWMDEPNQILYAAYYNGGVVAIDVSGTLSGDISSRMIDTLSFGAGNTYTWGVQLYNGSLYAMDMVSGLWQLDTANGALSVAAGGNNVPERYGSDLWVANGYAYTGTWGNRSTLGNAVKIWRLGATGAPTLVDSIVTAGITTVSDVEVSDDNKLLMFSAENGPNSGFWFYRLSDPAHPTFAGKYLVSGTTGGIHTATFSRINGRLYAFGARDPSGAALIILDITSLDQ